MNADGRKRAEPALNFTKKIVSFCAKVRSDVSFRAHVLLRTNEESLIIKLKLRVILWMMYRNV